MNIEIQQHGPVTCITLCRPQVRNAVDPETARELHAAFLVFDRDPRAAIAVLAGEGGNFSAGFDLAAVADGRTASWLEELHFGRDGQPPLGPMGPTRLALSKPVIGAIAGAAVAGGMELALWCDLRVMEESAYMGIYCRRWGVPLVDGGTVRLPRIVGRGRALDLVLTGRRVDARECLAIGLCERVVPAGEAATAARALASDLARLPPQCLRADRASLFGADGHDEQAALEAEFNGGLEVLRTEARAGAARFVAGGGRHGAPDVAG